MTAVIASSDRRVRVPNAIRTPSRAASRRLAGAVRSVRRSRPRSRPSIPGIRRARAGRAHPSAATGGSGIEAVAEGNSVVHPLHARFAVIVRSCPAGESAHVSANQGVSIRSDRGEPVPGVDRRFASLRSRRASPGRRSSFRVAQIAASQSRASIVVSRRSDRGEPVPGVDRRFASLRSRRASPGRRSSFRVAQIAASQSRASIVVSRRSDRGEPVPGVDRRFASLRSRRASPGRRSSFRVAQIAASQSRASIIISIR